MGGGDPQVHLQKLVTAHLVVWCDMQAETNEPQMIKAQLVTRHDVQANKIDPKMHVGKIVEIHHDMVFQNKLIQGMGEVIRRSLLITTTEITAFRIAYVLDEFYAAHHHPPPPNYLMHCVLVCCMCVYV